MTPILFIENIFSSNNNLSDFLIVWYFMQQHTRNSSGCEDQYRTMVC